MFYSIKGTSFTIGELLELQGILLILYITQYTVVRQEKQEELE